MMPACCLLQLGSSALVCAQEVGLKEEGQLAQEERQKAKSQPSAKTCRQASSCSLIGARMGE